MQRPEVNGWQVTTNENGVKMATLPRDTMEALLKYAEYAEKQLRIGSVSQRIFTPTCTEVEDMAVEIDQFINDHSVATAMTYSRKLRRYLAEKLNEYVG